MLPSAEEWPEADRRRPALSSPGYAVRAPLAGWLRGEAVRAAGRHGRYRVLDVGCGPKPYYPFFEPFAERYVGVDIDNPLADVSGPAEALPFPDGAFELVLCTQVLEHSSDPAQVVRELRRVVAPGGRVLASTHGVQVYHPRPDDLWRWTHTGLEQLFASNGPWSTLLVRPSSGTASCLGMLAATYVDLLARSHGAAPVGRALVSGINRLAAAADAHVPKLRRPGPGTLFANLHVVAEP